MASLEDLDPAELVTCHACLKQIEARNVIEHIMVVHGVAPERITQVEFKKPEPDDIG